MSSMIRREVALMTTGGTFDKIYPEGKGVREFAFSEQTQAHGILKRMRYETAHVFSMFPMDSLDMTEAHHEAIAKNCATHHEEALVVIHGTDTMIQTAQCIARLNLNKAVVLTGASQPAGMRDSDADTNLAGAIAVAQVIGHGVYIHMHGETYAWNGCEKTDDGRFEAC